MCGGPPSTGGLNHNTEVPWTVIELFAEHKPRGGTSVQSVGGGLVELYMFQWCSL